MNRQTTLSIVALLASTYTIIRIETLAPATYIFNTEIIQPHELTHFQNRQQLENFLEMDTTDLLDYRGGFKCLSFAEMLSYRAEENGYRVVVLIDAWDHNITVKHAYCMAYCIAEDTYYVIEPQSDAILYGWSYSHASVGEANKRTDPQVNACADEPTMAKSVKGDENDEYRLDGIPQSDPRKPEAREH